MIDMLRKGQERKKVETNRLIDINAGDSKNQRGWRQIDA